jgi:hypothetical protein
MKGKIVWRAAFLWCLGCMLGVRNHVIIRRAVGPLT